jgi:hypothetical protein
LVHGARSLFHYAVYRDPVAGPYEHNISNRQMFDSHFLDLAVPADAGGFRHQFSQCVNRVAGAIQRVVLAGVTQAEQEQQEGAFRPLAQDSRASRSGEHQHIGVKLAADEAWQSMCGNIVPACQIGKQEKYKRQFRGQVKKDFSGPSEEQKQPAQANQDQHPAVMEPLGEKRRPASLAGSFLVSPFLFERLSFGK